MRHEIFFVYIYFNFLYFSQSFFAKVGAQVYFVQTFWLLIGYLKTVETCFLNGIEVWKIMYECTVHTLFLSLSDFFKENFVVQPICTYLMLKSCIAFALK